MGDRLLRGTFPESNLRFASCQTAELCSEAIGRHHGDWLSGWLLAEALTCSTLISVGLKDGERLSVRWAYSGPIGTILTDLDENGRVRGFPQKLRLLPEISTLGEALGDSGRVSIVSSFPDRVGRVGITEAIFQDIGRDLSHFLSLSFQIETVLAVGLIIRPEEPVRVSSASGLLLQPLPGCDLLFFNELRETIEQPEFQGWLEASRRKPEELLFRLGIGESPCFLKETVPVYGCRCNREKVISVLRMLDPEEIREMLEMEGQADINCHFCAQNYRFSRNDLQAILEQCTAGHG